MNKCLLLLLFIFQPLIAFANDPMIEKQFNVINEAEKHRQAAISDLEKAQEMSLLIPNLEDRKHLQAIFSSAMAGLLVPRNSLVTYVLAVGGPLIVSLSADVFDKIDEYRLLLVSIDYHTEMYKFYDSLSTKLTEKAAKNREIHSFFQAIDFLTNCQKLCLVTNDKAGRNSIDAFKELKTLLMDEFQKSHFHVTKGMIEESWSLYENSGEMWEDCKDEILIDKLSHNIREIIVSLELGHKLGKKDRESENKKGSIVIIGGK